MSQSFWHYRGAWLAVGLVIGFLAAGFLPSAPIHAVATSQNDSLLMATGPMDEDGEAVIILDAVTGDLKAFRLHPRLRKFSHFFVHNVLADFGLNDAKNPPKFVMVTGAERFQRVNNIQLAQSIVYVAELTTGKLASYAMPWTRNARNVGGTAKFIPLDIGSFRPDIIRSGGN